MPWLAEKKALVMNTLEPDIILRRTALAVLLLATAFLCASPGGAAPDKKPYLVDYYDAWLVSVDHLILDAERRTFLSLASDVEREVFIRRFWEARGDGGVNVALERWQPHCDEARQRFLSLASDRAQAMMVAGSPARVLGFGGCAGPVRLLEIWSYSASQATYLTGRPDADDFYLVFVAPPARQGGALRQWSPADGLVKLMSRTVGRPQPTLEDLMRAAVLRPCVPATMDEIQAVRKALGSAPSAAELRQRVALPAPDPAWLDTFAAELARRGAVLPAAPLEIEATGHFKWYVVVRGRVRVPVSEIRRNADGLLFDRLVIVGDVWQARRLSQPFRVVHHVAGPEPGSATVALDFYRRLRPGTYTLSLRVEDGHGRALQREERELRLTWPEEEAVAPAGYRHGFAGLLRPEVGMMTTFPSVRLLAAGDDLMAGRVEIGAVTTGGPIARLDFLLNGEAAGSDEEPPYSVALELGRSPEPQVLEALAFDPNGRQIAHDRAELNIGSPHFAVRLVEPRRGQLGEHVRLEVDVPLEDDLDRVELFLDNEHFATLTEPPFVHPLPRRPLRRNIYVRAVAFLESGTEAEDLVVVDARPLEEIDVKLVELYTSVNDSHGRPVLGLSAEEFRVFEDGEEQVLERLDTLENLPVNVTLLMDISQSMRGRMRIATLSAQSFFEQVLTPKDRASFLTFNNDIRLWVPFTNDIHHLRHGTSGLRARGSTRLNDSLVYTVHYFGGRQGKKALVLLSDGHDVDSDFLFDHVLEHTLRSGVAVYAIGLGLDSSGLRHLAEKTGGRFYAIGSATELDRVYRQIEQDLRSQYLLLYRPPEKGGSAFRQVEVKVLRNGLKARTIHGYYP